MEEKLLLKLVKEQNRDIIKHIYLFWFLINMTYNEQRYALTLLCHEQVNTLNKSSLINLSD